MIRAYLVALDPTGAQVEEFRSHCGGQRYAYNFGLALVRANLDQRAAERSYGITDDQLTPAMSWSAFGLRKIWNEVKDERAPWWAENSKEAYSSGLANLATALSNWSSSKSGARAGRRVAFPRFKGCRARLSCRFTTGAFGLGPDRRHIRLPRIGLVRTHESTRTLARRIEAGTARIRSATLSHQRGRWHVAFSVELPDPRPPVRTGTRVVGVDVGIKSLAVLSTGEVVPNPRHLDGALRALRRTQRQASRRRGPDRRTRTVASNRWCKTTARVAALHTRVTDARRDGLHKLSTRLVRDHDVVVIEDLNVAGMIRNHRLARHICGLGIAELRRQLDYKTRDAGVRLIVANRWYPSSKTCSACGAVKAKLTLAQREFVCETCGTRLDRDYNAARNLAALAAQASEPSCGRTKNQPAGNPHKTATGGTGYRHGKTQILSQRRPREMATP
ncbi:MAG: IS607 family element RNA-guided endonuclease TnpB [Pseudonocardiaceae bacterium]